MLKQERTTECRPASTSVKPVVVDRDRFDADPDPDHPTFQFDADPDPDPDPTPNFTHVGKSFFF
jgi:hypothetical protein